MAAWFIPPTRNCGVDALNYAPLGLEAGIAVLRDEPVFAAILARAGEPRFRRRRNGFETLLHIILEQQVSIDAAAAMFRRLNEECRPLTPTRFLTLGEATLRRCGFSRQKAAYGRGLCEAVASGALDFTRLAEAPDDEAAATLIALKGIGRWTAEIYLIFALGRDDVWPAADLGRAIRRRRRAGAGRAARRARAARDRRALAAVADRRRLPLLAGLSARPQTRRTGPAAGTVRLALE